MKHAIRYEGGFERNHPLLRPGATTFLSTAGTEQPIPEWPADIDGLRIGYMEKAGKKFAAVRVQHMDREIVLEHPMLLDPARHLGNKRFAPQPTVIADNAAVVLLADLIELNRSQRADLLALREQLRPSGRSHTPPPAKP